MPDLQLHTESLPIFKHSYDYKHETVRDAVGLEGQRAKKAGYRFVSSYDSTDERQDIDTVKRKGFVDGYSFDGAHFCLPVKAERSRLYQQMCGVGNIEQVMHTRKCAPSWAKDTFGKVAPIIRWDDDTLKEAYAESFPKPMVDYPKSTTRWRQKDSAQQIENMNRTLPARFQPAVKAKAREIRAQSAGPACTKRLTGEYLDLHARIRRLEEQSEPELPLCARGPFPTKKEERGARLRRIVRDQTRRLAIESGMSGPEPLRRDNEVAVFRDDPICRVIDERQRRRTQVSRDAYKLMRQYGQRSKLDNIWSNVEDP